jgi:hypothetical protein
VVACMTQVRRARDRATIKMVDEIVWGMSVAWKRRQPGCFRGYVPLRRFFRFHAGSRVIPPASCKRLCGKSLVLGDLF